MSVFKYFKYFEAPSGYEYNNEGNLIEYAKPGSVVLSSKGNRMIAGSDGKATAVKAPPKPQIFRSKKSITSLRNANAFRSEMVMKTDSKLSNLKIPVDGPKGKSKFMKKMGIRSATSDNKIKAVRSEAKITKDYKDHLSRTKVLQKASTEVRAMRKENMDGMSQKSGDKRSTDSGAGMTPQGVAKYNRRTGGDLKTAVTTPPSKLKKGSKAAGRRKSFCARSKSWNGERGKAARARWNC